jgi:hypothetical protein
MQVVQRIAFVTYRKSTRNLYPKNCGTLRTDLCTFEDSLREAANLSELLANYIEIECRYYIVGLIYISFEPETK